jgi:glycosyltransferase involved in cell wall biosynthesis
MGDARSVHIERWSRYFDNEGYELALFSLEPKTISSSGKFYQGRRRTSVGIIDYTLAKKDFLTAVDDLRPDMISAHFVASYGWLASHYHDCPVIMTAWGSDLLILPDKSRLHRKRIERAMHHAAFCTVDNNNLHKAAAQFTSSDKIVRVVMGVDRKFFEIAARTEFSSGDPMRIIAPRGLEEVYDPQTIISAVSILRDKIGFRLDLLGRDPAAKDLAVEIEKKSLDDFISVHPFLPHDEFAASLKNYDIYLSASLSDSTSVALLEAMATGLFPVVSDIEGNREWIENGANGILFEPESPESLAEAILAALRMSEKFKTIAEANRRRIETEAIWQDNMHRLKELIMSLLGNG